MRRTPSANRCLGLALGEYVDGTLPPAERLACERHLVVCPCCRHAVETERRVLATLRQGGPTVSSDLHAMLLSLAGEGQAQLSPGRAARGPIDSARHPSRPNHLSHPSRVPGVDAGAPALHRSAMRAAVFAGLAAGASAAAAWSIGVGGAGLAPAAPATAPLNQPRPAQLRSGTLVPGPQLTRGTTVLTSFTPSRPVLARPAAGVSAGSSAQSTP